MKRTDWAQLEMKKIIGSGPNWQANIARALRAAERRGFMRAVKMLREFDPKDEDPNGWVVHDAADWLEEQR